MSTSFIDYHGKGYWMSDGFVELMANYFLQTMDTIVLSEPWHIEMKNQLNFIILGGCIGWNSFHFDEILKTEIELKEFVDVLQSTIKLIEAKGEYISAEELNKFEEPKEKQFQTKWLSDFETSRLVNLLTDLKLLLKGKKGYLPGDKIDYFW